MLKENGIQPEEPVTNHEYGFSQIRSWAEPVDENSGVWEKPYNAIASDFDGVVTLYGQESEEEADRIRSLMVEKTLLQGAPLAFITGKDEAEVNEKIIEPIRKLIKETGLELPASHFMVYANNGSVVIDAGLDNQTIERKEFTYDDLDKISQLRVVEIMMKIYDVITEIRSNIPEAFKNTRFREERTTAGFSIRPEDLKHPALRTLFLELKKLAGKDTDLTRFDIGQVFKQQLEQAGLNDIQVAVTDGAVDLTPSGTGKRNALEHFAKKTKTKVENILRMGDNGDGSDYQLLAPKKNETRGGYANTQLDLQKLSVLQSQYADFGLPRQINGNDSQFRKVIRLLESTAVVPQEAAIHN